MTREPMSARPLFLSVAFGAALLGVCSAVYWESTVPSPAVPQKVNENYPVSWPLSHPLSALGEVRGVEVAMDKIPAEKGQTRFEYLLAAETVRRISHLQFEYSGQTPVQVALRLNNERFPFDLNQVVATIKARHSTAQARALAAFQWVSKHYVNLIPPTGNGFPDHQAQVFTNSFRYGFCDDASEHLAQLNAALGVPSKVVGLNGHVIVQSEIDGRRVFFDPDYKMAYWNENNTRLLSREEVCKDMDRHFYADSVVTTVYPKGKVKRLAAILCEHDGKQGVVAASYRKGTPVGDSLLLRVEPGARIQFFPSKRLGRMAMGKPRVEDHARVGHMRVDTPLKLPSVYPAVVEKSFALPLLSASIVLEIETEHSFQLKTVMAHPKGMAWKPKLTDVAPGRSVVEIFVLELSDLAPYNNINQLAFTLDRQGHPQPDSIRMSARLNTAHQLASDAFPKLVPGQNFLALETSDGRLVEDVTWQLALQAYQDVTVAAPKPLPVAKSLKDLVRLEWEGSASPHILYDVEMVNEQAPRDFIFPVLAAGLLNPFLEIDGSALKKLKVGQAYQWRVRRRTRLGDIGPFSAWQDLLLSP